MAAISGVRDASVAVAQSGAVPTGTMEKVKAFMARAEGIGTVFSVLAGVAVGAVWGVSLGLLAAAVGGGAVLAVWGCRSRSAPPRGAIELDPALELHAVYHGPLPQREAGESEEARRERIGSLMTFAGEVVEKAILPQSPHFNNFGSLFLFLRDNFNGLKGTRLRVLSAHPGRFEGGEEAYEVTIQSESPRGWIRCYVPKERDRAVGTNGATFQRIERVTPFLGRIDAEQNYFATLNLPFRDTMKLRLALAYDYPEMDFMQVRVASLRNVSFNHLYRPTPSPALIISNLRYDGYEVNLSTPRGLAPYFVSLDGEHVAKPEDVERVVAR